MTLTEADKEELRKAHQMAHEQYLKDNPEGKLYLEVAPCVFGQRVSTDGSINWD